MRAAAALLPLLLAFLPAAHGAKAIPDAPAYYVLDEPGVLAGSPKRAIETLLIEHDRATSEQILIAVFKSLEGEDLVDYTNRVFQAWKIGHRGKNNGVLLALYWDDRKARIEVGYGLEPQLTDSRSTRILDDFLIPNLKNDRPDLALSQSAFEILAALESPLVESGKAKQILSPGGFTARTSGQRANRPLGGSSNFGLVVGIILVLAAIRFLLAGDAHYTSHGWYRPNPWRTRRSGGGWGVGGGGSGGIFGGGGGGFSGGGGRSGGGGASGSW